MGSASEEDLRFNASHQRFASAMMQCDHGGAFCAQDGFCHYDGACFEDVMSGASEEEKRRDVAQTFGEIEEFLTDYLMDPDANLLREARNLATDARKRLEGDADG